MTYHSNKFLSHRLGPLGAVVQGSCTHHKQRFSSTDHLKVRRSGFPPCFFSSEFSAPVLPSYVVVSGGKKGGPDSEIFGLFEKIVFLQYLPLDDSVFCA